MESSQASLGPFLLRLTTGVDLQKVGAIGEPLVVGVLGGERRFCGETLRVSGQWPILLVVAAGSGVGKSLFLNKLLGISLAKLALCFFGYTFATP